MAYFVQPPIAIPLSVIIIMRVIIVYTLILTLYSCRAAKLDHRSMKLWALSNYGETEQLISNRANEALIKSSINSLNWKEFHQVILEKSSGDFIEVGGSLGEDGLSAIYQKDEEQFVIISKPKSVEELTSILVLYFKDHEELIQKYKFE